VECAPWGAQFEKGLLKLFRPQHGDEEISQQPDRDEPDDDVFHGLKLSTRIGVKNRDGEEPDRDEHINDIFHFNFPFAR
jgi:hypothetical protein